MALYSIIYGIVVISGMASLSKCQTGSQCNIPMIDECVAEVNNFTSQFDEHREIIRTRENMEQQCRLMLAADRCARTYLERCNSTYRAFVGGQLDAHDYLCTDGLESYLRHQTCLADPSIEADVAACTHDIAMYDTVTTIEQLCNVTLHDVNCTYTHVQRRCNSTEAAVYQFTFELKKVEALLRLIGCDIPSLMIGPSGTSVTVVPQTQQSHTMSTQAAITLTTSTNIGESHKSKLGMIIGLTILVAGAFSLVMAIVAFVLYQRRKSSQTAHQQTRHGRSDPGPPAIPVSIAVDGSTALENPMYGIVNAPPPPYTEDIDEKEKVAIDTNMLAEQGVHFTNLPESGKV